MAGEDGLRLGADEEILCASDLSWRSEAPSIPARERTWTAAARFDAVLTTAVMDAGVVPCPWRVSAGAGRLGAECHAGPGDVPESRSLS